MSCAELFRSVVPLALASSLTAACTRFRMRWSQNDAVENEICFVAFGADAAPVQ